MLLNKNEVSRKHKRNVIEEAENAKMEFLKYFLQKYCRNEIKMVDRAFLNSMLKPICLSFFYFFL